jgi:glutathione S-transferase
MALTFYYWPRSSASRVYWALEELSVPFDKQRLDRSKGENKTPAYLAISPMGNVPALVDDGARFFESLAILIHLGQKFGVEKNLWPKRGTPEEADALSWSAWSTGELHAPRLELMKHTLDAPFALPKELKSPAIAELARKALYDRLAVLERRLAGREWLAGNAFSIADIASAGWVNSLQANLGLSLADTPHVKAWVARCTERPAFKKVMSET